MFPMTLTNQRLDRCRRWMFRVAFARVGVNVAGDIRRSVDLDSLARASNLPKRELGTEQI